MNELPLRERLLARKAEIERALEELDRIERLANGQDSKLAEESVHVDVRPTKSIAQAVYEELLGKSLTVQQLAAHLRVSESQVRNALTGHRLRRKAISTRVGGLLRYTIPVPAAVELVGGRPPLSDEIVRLMDSVPGKEWRPSEVGEALEGKVASNAKNFKATVAATLSNLYRSGRVKKAGRSYTSVMTTRN